MTPPQGSAPRPPKPRSASPAERSIEFADTQRRLKEEAAKRRVAAESAPPPRVARRAGTTTTRGRS
jgi:hypothetical protein